MKEVKYREYRIGEELFTVKLTYKPNGGLSYNPIVKVRIMKWHTKPITFLEKLLEIPKFSINCYEWDPLFLDCSLEEYCINKCFNYVDHKNKINKAEIEWGRI